MKVILTAEVKGKGHEGDVVEVTRGYAVNYLMPRKMAIEATAGNLKQLDARKGNIQKRNDARRGDAEQLASALEGRTVVIEAKAGDEGKLFGSVTTLMIEEAIAAQLSQDVDHRRMDLGRPIKVLGDYPVRVSVYGDVKAEVLVRVVGEGGSAEALAAPAAIEEPVADEPAVEEAAEPAEEVADEIVEDSVDESAESAEETAADEA
jgi:large subunit ribosomal protein L9